MNALDFDALPQAIRVERTSFWDTYLKSSFMQLPVPLRTRFYVAYAKRARNPFILARAETIVNEAWDEASKNQFRSLSDATSYNIWFNGLLNWRAILEHATNAWLEQLRQDTLLMAMESYEPPINLTSLYFLYTLLCITGLPPTSLTTWVALASIAKFASTMACLVFSWGW
jgi:hypothetical protein